MILTGLRSVPTSGQSLRRREWFFQQASTASARPGPRYKAVPLNRPATPVQLMPPALHDSPLNRTCNSVRRPDLIAFLPGRHPLPHAG
jgi:hypothetical protein